MKLDDRLHQVLEDVRCVAGWLWDRGWAERNAGNVSVDVTEEVAGWADGGRDLFLAPSDTGRQVSVEIPSESLAGRYLLVSAKGARFRDMSREPGQGLLLLRIAADARGYDVVWTGGGAENATSELSAHLRIHAQASEGGSGHRAVLHTHPTHLIALNQLPRGADAEWLNRALWAMMPEVRIFVADGVGVGPYCLPGSRALADTTATELRRHRVVLWDKHGCVAIERDLVEAFDLIDTLDKAARIYLLCLATGEAPRGLSDNELEELGALAQRMGVAR